jgi:hypothetical protein
MGGGQSADVTGVDGVARRPCAPDEHQGATSVTNDVCSASAALAAPLGLCRRVTDVLILAWFASTLFLSSALLFLIEPMVGKMLLPVLGGTPAVWNTCVLFFQAVLLAGYGYAHLVTRWRDERQHARVHVLLALLPIVVLPVSVLAGDRPPTTDQPALWLLGRLLRGVGLPFFVLSSTAPVLQRWFARSGHPAARDPYFLYAASNAGSLLALLAYPLVVEPLWALGEQSRLWAWGYIWLVVMVTVCAAVLRARAPATVSKSPAGHVHPIALRLGLRRRLRWVFWAFVPSSLMLGVTTHITTDLAAVPLLWVVPLALYLLTFVLVFARQPVVPRAWMLRGLPFVLLPVAVLLYAQVQALRWVLIPLHLLAFFVVAMVCHGRLADDRPPPAFLTEYYLWMSVGGVLGGLANAVVAPLVFPAVFEYPLVLALACLALPRQAEGPSGWRDRARDIAWPLALGGFTLLIVLALRFIGWSQTVGMVVLGYVVPAMICFSFQHRPLRMAAGFAGLVAVNGLHGSLREGRLLHIERNFFGVKQVRLAPDGRFRLLVHGGIVHGSQSTDPARRGEPTAYYHRRGPLGDIFGLLEGRGAYRRIAVVGLGAGTVACYARPGQHYTFYEIDPAVQRIAEDARYFTYLAECQAPYRVVLGDGRLTLATAPDGDYDLLILDAFSSDSIPAHLLTREALELYLAKLADGGVLAFHISNRYLNLAPLLGNLAAERGLVSYHRAERARSVDGDSGWIPSEYVVMARRRSDLGGLPDDPEWRRLTPSRAAGVWTDQYSNLLSVLR